MTQPSDDLDLNLAPGLPGPLFTLAPEDTCVNPATLVPALRPPGLTPVEPTFASNRAMVAALLAERREAIAKLALPAGAEVTINMPWEDFERLCELALEPAAGQKEDAGERDKLHAALSALIDAVMGEDAADAVGVSEELWAAVKDATAVLTPTQEG